MSSAAIESNKKMDELLRAASQLETDELRTLVQRIVELSARRRAPVLSESETVLFERINHTHPEQLSRRIQGLIQKRDQHGLTPLEIEELFALVEESEALAVERLRALVELANLRGKTLEDLMNDLGIVRPRYA